MLRKKKLSVWHMFSPFLLRKAHAERNTRNVTFTAFAIFRKVPRFCACYKTVLIVQIFKHCSLTVMPQNNNIEFLLCLLSLRKIKM